MTNKPAPKKTAGSQPFANLPTTTLEGLVKQAEQGTLPPGTSVQKKYYSDLKPTDVIVHGIPGTELVPPPVTYTDGPRDANNVPMTTANMSEEQKAQANRPKTAQDLKPPTIPGDKPLSLLGEHAQKSWGEVATYGGVLGPLGSVMQELAKVATFLTDNVVPTEIQVPIMEGFRSWSGLQQQEIQRQNKDNTGVVEPLLGIRYTDSNVDLYIPYTPGWASNVIRSGAEYMFSGLLSEGAIATEQVLGAYSAGNYQNQGLLPEDTTARERADLGRLYGTWGSPTSYVVEVGKVLTNTAADIISGSPNAVTKMPALEGLEVLRKKFAASFDMQYKAPGMIGTRFVERLRSGENVDILTREMSDPMKELLCQVVVDPLNYVGMVTAPLKAYRYFEKAQETWSLAKAIDRAGDAENAVSLARAMRNSAMHVASADDLKTIEDAVTAWRKTVEAERKLAQFGGTKVNVSSLLGKTITVGGQGAGRVSKIVGRIISPLSSNRAARARSGMAVLFETVLASTKASSKAAPDVARSQKIFMAIARVALGEGDDIEAYRDALRFLVSQPGGDAFLSPGGMDAGKTLADLLFDETGHLNDGAYTRFARSMAQTGMGRGGDVSHMIDVLARDIEDQFPSITRRLELEKKALQTAEEIAKNPPPEVGKLVKAANKLREKSVQAQKAGHAATAANALSDAAKLESQAQRAMQLPTRMQYWLDNPVSNWERFGNKILSGQKKVTSLWMTPLNKIYITFNPGQWGRNMINNIETYMIDHGLGGSLYRGDALALSSRRLVEQGLWSPHALSGYTSKLPKEPGVIPEASKGIEEALNPPVKGIRDWWKKVKGTGNRVEVTTSAKSYLAGIREAKNSTIRSGVLDVILPSGIGKNDGRKMVASAVEGMSGHDVAVRRINGEFIAPVLTGVYDGNIEQERKVLGLLQGTPYGDEIDRMAADRSLMDDDVWAMFERKIQGDANIGRSQVHNPMSLESEHLADEDKLVNEFAQDMAAAGEQPNPVLMAKTNAYRAQHVAGSEMSAVAQDAGSGIMLSAHNRNPKRLQEWQELQGGKGGAVTGELDELSASRAAATSEADELRRTRVAGETKDSWDLTFRKIDAAYYRRLEEQTAIRQRYFQKRYNMIRETMAEEALANGMPQPQALEAGQAAADAWVDKIRPQLDLYDDLRGDAEWVQNWTLERFVNNNSEISIAGVNGNPVVNLFTKNRVPTADSIGRPYSWTRMQTLLSNYGVDVPRSKLVSGKGFTAEELDAIETACLQMRRDAIGFTGEANIAGGVPEAMGPVSKEPVLSQLSDEDRAAWEKANVEYQRLIGGTTKPSGEQLAGTLEEQQALLKRQNRAASLRQKMDALEAKVELKGNNGSMLPGGDVDSPSLAQAIAHQEQPILAAVRDARKRMITELTKTPAAVSPEEAAEWSAWAAEVDRRLAALRAPMIASGNAARDFTMLNYEDRYGFDVALNFLFPYHFWYTRSYKHWASRLAYNPGTLAKYALYRKTLQEQHANMPEFWRQQVSSNELFGLNMDNPMMFNLESTIWPLNGLTGVDFTDPDRVVDGNWLETFIDQTGKFGPSVHTPYLLAMGLYEYAMGNKEAGESWIGRLIPQTATLKALTGMVGIDPFNTGGLEIDPSVVLQGGLTKYERKGVARVLSIMAAEGVAPYEDLLEAGRTASGPLWNQAVDRYNSDRNAGRLMSSIGGPGFKMRPAADMMIDDFYTEMNTIYAREAIMGTQEKKQAWNALFQKYPYASIMLMARKSGPARDEAYIYDILRRIPPSQSTIYFKQVGLTDAIVESFYADGFDKMSATDQMRLKAAMMDLGAITLMPPQALRIEWDTARERYSAVFGGVDPAVQESMNTYYQQATAADKRLYLSQHPEAVNYLAMREKAIYSDPLLMKYYGGIKFLEDSFISKLNAEVSARWPGIEAKMVAYQDLKRNGGDTKAFLIQYPEVGEAMDLLNSRDALMEDALNRIGAILPETPSGFWRPDAREQSTTTDAILKAIAESQTPMQKSVSALAEPFMPGGGKDVNLQFQEFLQIEAEKAWPGVVALNAEYERVNGENKALGTAFLNAHPTVTLFRRWKSGLEKRFNAQPGNKYAPDVPPMDWGSWAQMFDESTRRLMVAYFNGSKMSSALRSSLQRMWNSGKQPGGDFDLWLDSLQATYTP